MAKQLTIFMENRPGRMKSVSDVLLENDLNIWAFTIQDRGDFGLMKLIVDKPDQARLILADRGYACVVKDVLAVTAENDQPGNLDKLTALLLEKGVNIRDAYGFVSQKDRQGVCFMEVDNPEKVDIEEVITAHGFTVLTGKELYQL